MGIPDFQKFDKEYLIFKSLINGKTPSGPPRECLGLRTLT
jgi:hypothetical protein